MHKQNHNRSDVSEYSAIESSPTFMLPNEAATTTFASKLSQVINSGMVIYLRGDLGAGKTTLVRALLNALGYQGRVKSPTYTLLEQYDLEKIHIRHFDLYRFQDPMEWEAAGFSDEFDGVNICLIEWPEKAQGLLPGSDLEIILDILPEGRKITLLASTGIGRECLKKLAY